LRQQSVIQVECRAFAWFLLETQDIKKTKRAVGCHCFDFVLTF